MNFKLLVLFLIFGAINSFAGNGSSGGGNIHGNQVNPWFLQNTKQVSYCIEVGQNFSSLDFVRLHEIVLSAIDYWKEEFSQTEVQYHVNADFEPEPRLATQNYKFEDCTDQVDIRFQFGTLSQEQKNQLGDTEQIIASTYRTYYDEVNLRGKGFIYVASEKGELRPKSIYFARKPWSYGYNNILLYTLIHELGHVYGLPDLSSNKSDLMGRHFVEFITSKKDNNYKNFDKYLSRKDFKYFKPLGFDGKFNSTWNFSITPPFKMVLREGIFDYCYFLDLSCSESELYLHFKGSGNRIELYQMPNENGRKTLVGEFDLSTETISTSMQSSDYTPSVWLTKKQKVFKIGKYMLENTMWLYAFPSQGIIRNVTYKSASGVRKRVIINFFNPVSFAIGTIHNGDYLPDIFGWELVSR